MEKKMDRRQRKSRDAILGAFTRLLSKKSFDKITVAEILEEADVGRATFYAHFETKDYLLKELCEELFGHIFQAEEGGASPTKVFDCDKEGDVFLHLFWHVKEDEKRLGKLFTNDTTGLFLGYFKAGVQGLIVKHSADFSAKKPQGVPEEFWINHLTATFIETLRWWIERGMKLSAESICAYYLSVV